MKLPNPNQDKDFDRVVKDENGQPLYGIRNEHNPDEEVVHIPSGRSNQTYWKPEVVMNPEGCEHDFVLIDVGHREIECTNCHYASSFIPGVNEREQNGQLYVTLRGCEYSVKTS